MRKSKIVRAALVGLAALGIALPSAAAHQLDRYSNMLSERNSRSVMRTSRQGNSCTRAAL